LLRISRSALFLSGLAFLNAAHAGPGINQFEVKDLEVEVGRWEVQSQNAYSWNQPQRESIEEPPGEIVFDENTVVERRHALEAYGTVDCIGNSGRPGEETELFGDHDQHRVGPIAYYQREFGRGDDPSELRLGIGILAGLNNHTPDGTFKLSIEYEF